MHNRQGQFNQNFRQHTPSSSNIQSSAQKPNCNYPNNNIYQNKNILSNNNFNSTNSCSYNNNENMSNHANTDSLLINDVYGKDSTCDNLENLLKNISNQASDNDFNNNSNNTANNNSTDFSSIFSSFFQNSGKSNNSSDSTMPDIETILKFKKIFERLNSKSSCNDPIVNLLYAVKPFMQESKKSIIDQLAKFMTISTALQDFSSFL